MKNKKKILLGVSTLATAALPGALILASADTNVQDENSKYNVVIVQDGYNEVSDIKYKNASSDYAFSTDGVNQENGVKFNYNQGNDNLVNASASIDQSSELVDVTNNIQTWKLTLNAEGVKYLKDGNQSSFLPVDKFKFGFAISNNLQIIDGTMSMYISYRNAQGQKVDVDGHGGQSLQFNTTEGVFNSPEVGQLPSQSYSPMMQTGKVNATFLNNWTISSLYGNETNVIPLTSQNEINSQTQNWNYVTTSAGHQNSEKIQEILSNWDSNDVKGFGLNADNAPQKLNFEKVGSVFYGEISTGSNDLQSQSNISPIITIIFQTKNTALANHQSDTNSFVAGILSSSSTEQQANNNKFIRVNYATTTYNTNQKYTAEITESIENSASEASPLKNLPEIHYGVFIGNSEQPVQEIDFEQIKKAYSNPRKNSYKIKYDFYLNNYDVNGQKVSIKPFFENKALNDFYKIESTEEYSAENFAFKILEKVSLKDAGIVKQELLKALPNSSLTDDQKEQFKKAIEKDLAPEHFDNNGKYWTDLIDEFVNAQKELNDRENKYTQTITPNFINNVEEYNESLQNPQNNPKYDNLKYRFADSGLQNQFKIAENGVKYSKNLTDGTIFEYKTPDDGTFEVNKETLKIKQKSAENFDLAYKNLNGYEFINDLFNKIDALSLPENAKTDFKNLALKTQNQQQANAVLENAKTLDISYKKLQNVVNDYTPVKTEAKYQNLREQSSENRYTDFANKLDEGNTKLQLKDLTIQSLDTDQKVEQEAAALSTLADNIVNKFNLLNGNYNEAKATISNLDLSKETSDSLVEQINKMPKNTLPYLDSINEVLDSLLKAARKESQERKAIKDKLSKTIAKAKEVAQPSQTLQKEIAASEEAMNSKEKTNKDLEVQNDKLNAVMNREVLASLIEKANNLNPKSSQLQYSLNNAQDVLNNSKSTVEEIQASVNDLQQALNKEKLNLAIENAQAFKNKTDELTAEIQKAQQLSNLNDQEQSTYDQEADKLNLMVAKIKLQEVIDKANKVSDKSQELAAEITNAANLKSSSTNADELNQETNKLNNLVEKNNLLNAIKEAKEINNPSSRLAKAIAEAEKTAQKDYTKQIYDNAANTLRNIVAQNAQSQQKARERLSALIATAKNQNKASQQLQDQINSSQSVLDNQDSNVENLEESYDLLQKSLSREELIKAIEKAKLVKEQELLSSAITEAQNVESNEKSSSEDYQTQISKLQLAINKIPLQLALNAAKSVENPSEELLRQIKGATLTLNDDSLSVKQYKDVADALNLALNKEKLNKAIKEVEAISQRSPELQRQLSLAKNTYANDGLNSETYNNQAESLLASLKVEKLQQLLDKVQNSVLLPSKNLQDEVKNAKELIKNKLQATPESIQNQIDTLQKALDSEKLAKAIEKANEVVNPSEELNDVLSESKQKMSEKLTVDEYNKQAEKLLVAIQANADAIEKAREELKAKINEAQQVVKPSELLKEKLANAITVDQNSNSSSKELTDEKDSLNRSILFDKFQKLVDQGKTIEQKSSVLQNLLDESNTFNENSSAEQLNDSINKLFDAINKNKLASALEKANKVSNPNPLLLTEIANAQNVYNAQNSTAKYNDEAEELLKAVANDELIKLIRKARQISKPSDALVNAIKQAKKVVLNPEASMPVLELNSENLKTLISKEKLSKALQKAKAVIAPNQELQNEIKTAEIIYARNYSPKQDYDNEARKLNILTSLSPLVNVLKQASNVTKPSTQLSGEIKKAQDLLDSEDKSVSEINQEVNKINTLIKQNNLQNALNRALKITKPNQRLVNEIASSQKLLTIDTTRQAYDSQARALINAINQNSQANNQAKKLLDKLIEISKLVQNPIDDVRDQIDNAINVLNSNSDDVNDYQEAYNQLAKADAKDQLTKSIKNASEIQNTSEALRTALQHAKQNLASESSQTVQYEEATKLLENEMAKLPLEAALKSVLEVSNKSSSLIRAIDEAKLLLEDQSVENASVYTQKVIELQVAEAKNDLENTVVLANTISNPNEYLTNTLKDSKDLLKADVANNLKQYNAQNLVLLGAIAKDELEKSFTKAQEINPKSEQLTEELENTQKLLEKEFAQKPLDDQKAILKEQVAKNLLNIAVAKASQVKTPSEALANVISKAKEDLKQSLDQKAYDVEASELEKVYEQNQKDVLDSRLKLSNLIAKANKLSVQDETLKQSLQNATAMFQNLDASKVQLDQAYQALENDYINNKLNNLILQANKQATKSEALKSSLENANQAQTQDKKAKENAIISLEKALNENNLVNAINSALKYNEVKASEQLSQEIETSQNVLATPKANYDAQAQNLLKLVALLKLDDTLQAAKAVQNPTQKLTDAINHAQTVKDENSSTKQQLDDENKALSKLMEKETLGKAIANASARLQTLKASEPQNAYVNALEQAIADSQHIFDNNDLNQENYDITAEDLNDLVQESSMNAAEAKAKLQETLKQADAIENPSNKLQD
ncbi:hypothetical protein WG616_01910 [[Mycoplasma] gypis]|uniref:ECM-binding protein homolog n=3 Tax=[Mycoplasma] gypis TaxID=92404 RepID=A0ABZ2RM39_9BACT